jgi:hypothetical protein
MNTKLFATVCITIACVAAICASIAIGETAKSSAGSQPEFKLPEGWTAEDMQACIVAGTPGDEHKHLAKSAGKWQGKNTMWMGPDAEPMASECTATVTPIMEGRFVKTEWSGDSGMGPYTGFGITGFDNVSQKYVSIWIDNHGTGIMQGEGERAADGKKMTLEYTHSCPITKKPAVMRSIETITGPNTKTLEMFATDPKTGKEYKMMRVELTKKEGSTQAGG